MTPQELAQELERIYGGELKSVVLYGSKAGPNHSKKFSDINIFCVLNSPTPARLSKANSVVRKWVKNSNPPPHFFGPEHIERSLDVFPIEFLDMMAKHQVLTGSDPFVGIKVDLKNLRHQCESELKGKLIHLRAFYALWCHKPGELAKTMVRTFPQFLAAFRAMLRLAKIEPPDGAKAVVEKAALIAGFNPEIFLDIISIREGSSLTPRGDDALQAFESYLTELETITIYVDQIAS